MPRGSLGFFTVDPATGKITYTFNGVIYAQGLNLLAGSQAAPPDVNRITWRYPLITGGGAVDMAGTRQSNPQFFTQWRLGVQDPSDGQPFAFAALAQADAAAQALTGLTVGLESGTVSATILNGLAQSTFLKLATLANRKIAFGSASMNFPTSTNGDATVVAHGLGVQPAIVICMALQAPNYNQIPVYSLSASDATNFTVIGFVPVARAGGISFYWLAIG